MSTKAALIEIVAECLDRSRAGEAMTVKAEADFAALDAVIIEAGYDPHEIVSAAYYQE
jgi:hypothetical protein